MPEPVKITMFFIANILTFPKANVNLRVRSFLEKSLKTSCVLLNFQIEYKNKIGVDIRPEDLILKTICHSNKGKEYLQFYFECRKWLGEIENKEPHKCERLKWHEWNNTPEHTCPYLKEAVGKINDGISFYEDTF